LPRSAERDPADSGPAADASLEPDAPPAEQRPASVLVVDDDPSLRLICRFNLEAAGMAVREAPDGASAIAIATAEPPDAIILDVMMPGLDGWEVARALRAHPATRTTPIVFVTARMSDHDRERGVELAAAAYVSKPFDPSALTDLIERLVANRAGV
jgi:CheY-like chemotaxis protein